MTPQRRRTVLIGVMMVVLLCGAAWSFSGMMDGRAKARRAAQELAECRGLVCDIELLRDEPVVAAARDLDEKELGRPVERSAKQAGLPDPEQWLANTEPRKARRVGETPYLRKRVVLDLRGLSLGQLGVFLHHLTEGSELNVQDLHLRTPRGDSEGDTWDADVTLSYLIYAPAEETDREH